MYLNYAYKQAMNIIVEEMSFEDKQKYELEIFMQKQAHERFVRCNKLNQNDVHVINTLSKQIDAVFENMIMRVLQECDFINSGSYSAISPTENMASFTNTTFYNVLQNMELSQKIKVRKIKRKSTKAGAPVKNRNKVYNYYYTRISTEQAESMSEDEIKSKLWQNRNKTREALI